MPESEVELKLRVRSEDLLRLRTSPLLGSSAGKDQVLETVYFDTADLRLRRRNASLGVRKQGRQYLQTLRTNGTALARHEWVSQVNSIQPDFSSLEKSSAPHLAKVADGDLAPIFTSRIKRTLQRFENGASGNGAASVAISIAEGEIRTPAGDALPVSEVELELKGGEKRALFDLALALNDVAPVRLETRSEVERGYRLVAGETGKPVYAVPIHLARDGTVEATIGAIMHHCLDHLVANEELVLREGNALALHQMRVALRRMRSALSLFRRLLPPLQQSFFTGEMKWLARALGPARDCDVFLGELLVPVQTAFAGDAAIGALEAAARERRASAYQSAIETIQSPRYAILLLKLGAWVEAKSWREQPLSEVSATLLAPIAGLADLFLTRHHRKARQQGAKFAALSAAERHQLRIKLKKLRYAAEFFRSLYDEKPVAKYLKRVARLQSALGHLNDVATANKLVDEIGPRHGEGHEKRWGDAAGKLIGWHARGLRESEPQLAAEWRKFAKAKPFWPTRATKRSLRRVLESGASASSQNAQFGFSASARQRGRSSR